MIFLAQIIIFICGASFVGSKNSCDRRTEVAHKNECFKLLDLDLRAQFAACKSNHTSTVNIICLKQIFHKFLTIYTQSPVIKDPGDSATSQSYQFNVLETSRPADQIKAKYNEHLWKRLIQNNKINLMSNNNSRKPLNIYIHFYSFKNNVYIKNQPVNDGDPNLLIHLGHADELTTGSNCIFGHQINTSNESFQFKSENCETRLPFICVKALETKSRCATFRTSPPGGHWVECDRPATLLDGSAYTISDTQKCCMYNVHWRVEFDEVRKTCSRFDARVFSYKSRGYKSALDSYAMYLNSNYDKGAIDDLFAKFWTSCKHKEQNKEDECADEEVKLEKAVADYGARINNGFEIVSFSTTEDEKKNMMFLPNYLNLTRVYKTLRFISNNFELNELRFKPLILTSDRSNCSFINANSLTDLNRDFLLDCLLADYELLTQNSVFLASRERTGHFIEMDRTQKRVLYNGETTAKMMGIEDNSGVSCFYFHRVSEQLAHVSLPFLNKCFHFSVIDLNSTEEIDQVTENNAFWPFEAANSSLVSTDNLNSIRIEELSGVLASLGVIKIECTSIAVNTVNRSDNFLIIGTANTSAEYFNCSRGLFQLKNLNEQYKSNDPSDRLAMLLSKLNLRALLLHSVSFIRHVVRLDCESTARQVWRQIESCRQFNEQRICPVECPVTCEWSSDGGVWQIHPFQYYLESSICKAAVHAGAFKSVSKQRRAVLFIGEANGLDDVYQLYNNRIQTYVWRPFERLISGAHAYSHISFNFDRHNVDLSNRVEPEPHNQFENGVILTRAIHFVGENETMSVGLKVYTNGYLKSIRFFPILVHKDLQDDDEYVDDSSVEEEFLHSTVSNGSTNVNYSLTDVTLTSESLNALNSYFELDVNGTRTGLKFPVNIARNGSLQDNFKLNLNHVAAFSSHEVRLNLKPVYQTQTRVRQLKCMWYISGLNVSDSTMRPCNLTIPSRIERFNTADITELDIVIYPILELTEPAQSTRKFMRVFYFSKTLNGANKCQNMGVEVRDECVCLPGFGGPMCAKTCDAGYFGSDCRFECPGLNCSGYLVCSIDPIGCRCAAGFKGYGCDEPCSKGVWGSECSFKCNCSGSKCNRFNGECVCESTTKGAVCDECVDGYFGTNCISKCESSCLKCDKLTGECLEISSSTNTTTDYPSTTQLITTSTEELVTLNANECDYQHYVIQSLADPFIQFTVQIFQFNVSFELACYLDLTICLRAGFNETLESYFEKKMWKIELLEYNVQTSSIICDNKENIHDFFNMVLFTKAIEIDEPVGIVNITVDLTAVLSAILTPDCIYYFVLDKNDDFLGQNMGLNFLSYNFSCELASEFNILIKYMNPILTSELDRNGQLDSEFRQLLDKNTITVPFDFNTTSLDVVSVLTVNSGSGFIHFLSSSKMSRALSGCYKCQNRSECETKFTIEERMSLNFNCGENKTNISGGVDEPVHLGLLWVVAVLLVVLASLFFNREDRPSELSDPDLIEALYFDLFLKLKHSSS